MALPWVTLLLSDGAVARAQRKDSLLQGAVADWSFHQSMILSAIVA